MAKKDKPSGTARVIGESGPQIPDPEVQVFAKEEAAPAPVADKPAPSASVSVDPRHIVAMLSANSAEARAARLEKLSRSNRDVAWLVEEFKKLQPK